MTDTVNHSDAPDEQDGVTDDPATARRALLTKGGAAGGVGVRGRSAGTQGVGVRGDTNQSNGIGVYGFHASSTQSGTGVVGESNLGVGVIGRGTSIDVLAAAAGRIRMSATGHDGSPTTSGTTGTIARDADGNLWYC